MTINESVEDILGGFLERNNSYAVDLYINNAITNSSFGKIFITADRIYEIDNTKIKLRWDKDEYCHVRYNEISLSYDEIMKCYEEVNKEDNLKISETVKVILKNGMEFDFVCVGIRI